MTTPLHRREADTSAGTFRPFESVMADSVRQLRESAEGLTQRESKFLTDVARGRYLGGVGQLLEIARYRCPDPSAATAVAEGMRGYVLTGHPGIELPFIETLRYEGATNVMANEALVEHMLNPSQATLERMVEAHRAQEIASRAVCDLMHSARNTYRRSLR